MSSKISLRTEESTDVRRPSFAIKDWFRCWRTFRRYPMGHEFTSLVLALLQAVTRPRLQELMEQIQELDGEFEFETYFPSRQNCPDVVMGPEPDECVEPEGEAHLHRRSPVPGRSRAA